MVLSKSNTWFGAIRGHTQRVSKYVGDAYHVSTNHIFHTAVLPGLHGPAMTKRGRNVL